MTDTEEKMTKQWKTFTQFTIS